MQRVVRRITLGTSSLQAGGAERVISTLANCWSADGVEVHIVTLSKESTQPFYRLDRRVVLTQLGVTHPSANAISAGISNIRRIMRLRRAIASTQPDVVISFLTETNVLTLMAMLGTKIPVIVAEHTDPNTCPVPWIWGQLRRLTYRFAKKVVVLNRHAHDYFRDQMRIETAVIPNPIIQPEGVRNINERKDAKQIVSMGRFATEKRFDVLLRAFHRISEQYPDWKLTIIGDGPQLGDMHKLAKELGVSDKVSFPGVIDEPEMVLRQSNIFVSTSVLEGFPMALCEAMANGLAVISTEYNAGVRDIVEDDVNGLLVPPENEQAVAAAMDRLITNQDERERLGNAARSIVDKYGVDQVLAIWDSVFEQVLGKVPRQRNK